ncbi:MAG: lysophospholipid acyltransferase family protein [Woeseiaceae bacterium]|nr:lysophospholipid acyltransferase family protein [Woeseiaceae bacterium]
MTDFEPSTKTAIGGALFGVYAWLAFVLCVILGILFALLVPGLERRRRWVTASARASFRLCAIPVEVNGMGHLPAGHCVVVANHASYVDGVVLFGYLPPRFSFVIKGEMRKFPVVNFLLRRIGSKFVERFDASGSARDARHLLRAASSGESLAVFPEGTFEARPGLNRFRAGAFAAAINAGVPVVPTVISGSRSILGGGRILPRHGRLRIDILPAISPGDPEYGDSARLAEMSRQRILAVLDEPDLLA